MLLQNYLHAWRWVGPLGMWIKEDVLSMKSCGKWYLWWHRFKMGFLIQFRVPVNHTLRVCSYSMSHILFGDYKFTPKRYCWFFAQARKQTCLLLCSHLGILWNKSMQSVPMCVQERYKYARWIGVKGKCLGSYVEGTWTWPSSLGLVLSSYKLYISLGIELSHERGAHPCPKFSQKPISCPQLPPSFDLSPP